MRQPRPVILPTQPATKGILLAAGFSRTMIATQLRSGNLVRLRAGVFLAASALPVEPTARHLAAARAEQTRHPGSVLSHESAAIIWGFPTPGTPWHDSPPSVCFGSESGHKSSRGVATHRLGPLPAHHVARDPEGYPVTSIARTAVDLAAGLALPEQLVILDAAARRLCESLVISPRRRDYANEKLIAESRRLFREAAAVRRLARVRAAVAICTPERESAAESFSAGYFHVAGIPKPLFQPAIRTAAGIFYPDCYWPRQNLIGECDGAVKYNDPLAYEREKEREQFFRDAGYRVVRWLAKEAMFQPHVMTDRVWRSLQDQPDSSSL